MLTEKALKAVASSETIKGRIATALGKSFFSIHQYVLKNDMKLTTAAALQIIREETGLTDEEILEPVTTK